MGPTRPPFTILPPLRGGGGCVSYIHIQFFHLYEVGSVSAIRLQFFHLYEVGGISDIHRQFFHLYEVGVFLAAIYENSLKVMGYPWPFLVRRT